MVVAGKTGSLQLIAEDRLRRAIPAVLRSAASACFPSRLQEVFALCTVFGALSRLSAPAFRLSSHCALTSRP
jgi:hypothetical protein